MNIILNIQKSFFLLILLLAFSFSQHFNVTLEETGESTLFIFQDSIESLEVGDELGLFDSNGILDSDGNTGEVLVGAGTWTGTQVEITAISSADLSEFGGPILPGSVSGNSMVLKVWKASESLEYDAEYLTSSGSGSFNGLFTAVDSVTLIEPDPPYYNVTISETGESTLFIFQDSIDGLESGDELGLFDSNGILDSNGNTGEVLVGAGIWSGSQIEIVAIGAVDLSEFGGPILPGAVSGNTMSLKVFKSAEEVEYQATYTTGSGSGSFNGLFSSIDSISLEAACADDDASVSPFGCATAAATFGCDFAWGGSTIGEFCPETCGTCPVYGCTDDTAENYNPDANTDDGSCEYPACADNDSLVSPFTCEQAVGQFGCSFQWGDQLISEACPESCGECEGDECGSGIFDCEGVCDGTAVEDCAGDCGGSAELDDCGVCNGGNQDDLGCGCFEPGPSGCDNQCGSSLEEDCAGDCGGSAVEDDCGVCDGDNSCFGCTDSDACNYDSSATLDDGSCTGPYLCDDGSTLVCDLSECPDGSGGEISDGCDLPANNLYLMDGSVLYNSQDDIAGFQFDLEGGATVTGGSGGAAADAGFVVQGAGATVLGFSFTGASIPAGCGALTNLSLSGTATGLSGIVMSSPDGIALDFTYYEGGDDDGGDGCASGIFDCEGVCDGTAVEDCAGDCGGSAVEDECGVCEGNNSTCCTDEFACNFGQEGDCEYADEIYGEYYDCEGECIVELDECGICGGNGYIDDCGICDDNIDNDCIQDCNGDWGGSAVEDECGVCNGDGPEENFDCDGNCISIDTDGDGLCDLLDADDDNDNVLDENDSDPLDNTLCSDNDNDLCDDCSSTVFDEANDGPDYDADGLCDVGDSDDDNDNVLDENDFDDYNEFICFDLDSDTCDDCSSGTFDNTNDGLDTDSDGLCNAGDTDDDNDGVSDENDSNPIDNTVCSDIDSDTCDDCSSGTFNVSNDGLDSDGDGLCDLGDDCASGIFDCAGVCDGTALIDDCGECVLPEDFNYALDDCGVCFGENSDQDCLGVCFGDAIVDECGVCDGSGPEENFDCDGSCVVDIDCTGLCGGDAVVDECGVCEGTGIADGACDCDGNTLDCAGDCGGSAVEDECGVCDGTGPQENFDCDGNCLVDIDCSGVCGGDAILDECGVCEGTGIADGTCDCDGTLPSSCWDGSSSCEECPDTPGNYPDWDLDGDGVLDNFNDFENNGSITARVYEDGQNLSDMGDLIAAFVGSEQRGVAPAYEIPAFFGGGYAFLMMIYSNETSGETLSFKYYSSATDEVLDIGTIVEFENNMILGSANAPYELEILTDIDVNLDFAAGWNWFSLNVVSDDMSLNNVLNGLEPGSATYIKSATAFADYYDGYGWYGQLSQFGINNTEMYKLFLVYNEVLEFTGAPVDAADTPITLSTGWNWIGYTPQVAYALNYALGGIGPDNGSYIKGQAGFADYYSGYGWYGGLNELSPFGGYQIFMLNEDEFTYPSDGLSSNSQSDEFYDINNYSVWDVNPHDYEFNGSATIEIIIDNEKIADTDYYLAAFDGNDCVGLTKSYQFPINDSYVFGLMMYNNKEEALLDFKLYDMKNEGYIDLDQQMNFYSDMHLGDGLSPIVFFGNTSVVPNEFEVSSAYPNPFNPIVNFDISLNDASFISAAVYNLSGQKIDEIFSGNLNQGINTLTWNAVGFASGIYFINVESSSGLVSSQKISLLK